MVRINPFIAVLRGEEPERIPIWFMRQAGRYLPEYHKMRQGRSIQEMCSDPSLINEVTKQPVNILGVDAAIIFSDIMVPLEAMGFEITFREGVGPVVSNSIKEKPDMTGITPFHEKNLKYPIRESITRFRENNPGVPLIGFTGGPITLLSYATKGSADRDLEITKNVMYTREGTYLEALDMISEMIVSYAKLQISAGVDAIQIFDSWAGSLSPYVFEKYVDRSLRIVLESLKDTGTPIIYFGTGLSGLLDQITKLNFDVLSMDWRVRLSKVRSMTRGKFILQGNLDPRVAATPNYLQETKNILEDIGEDPNFIFNLGHGVIPITPPENLRSIVNYVHSFR